MSRAKPNCDRPKRCWCVHGLAAGLHSHITLHMHVRSLCRLPTDDTPLPLNRPPAGPRGTRVRRRRGHRRRNTCLGVSSGNARLRASPPTRSDLQLVWHGKLGRWACTHLAPCTIIFLSQSLWVFDSGVYVAILGGHWLCTQRPPTQVRVIIHLAPCPNSSHSAVVELGRHRSWPYVVANFYRSSPRVRVCLAHTHPDNLAGRRAVAMMMQQIIAASQHIQTAKATH